MTPTPNDAPSADPSNNWPAEAREVLARMPYIGETPNAPSADAVAALVAEATRTAETLDEIAADSAAVTVDGVCAKFVRRLAAALSAVQAQRETLEAERDEAQLENDGWAVFADSAAQERAYDDGGVDVRFVGPWVWGEHHRDPVDGDYIEPLSVHEYVRELGKQHVKRASSATVRDTANDRLRAKVQQLQAQCDANAKDVRRLDWLEEQRYNERNPRGREDDPPDCCSWTVQAQTWDVRAAIDAAMSLEGGQG